MSKTMKHLYGHVNPETSYVVTDYPWGFRLRTTIRYWIESKPGHGQRYCSQTINPKTGKWCAPKRGTYFPILILYLDENSHVHADGLSHWASKEKIELFKNIHIDFLDDFQKEQLKVIIARNRVMEHVEWEIKPCPIGPVSLTSEDPIDIAKREAILAYQEEEKKRSNENFKQINKAISREFSKVIL